jgi:hypothetical protein
LYNKIIANDRKMYKKRSINCIIATSTKSLDLVLNLLLLRSGIGEIDPKKAAGNHLEVVSKPRIRFKGKAQADRESAAYMRVCEHLSEACNTAIGPQMGF